MTSFDEAVRRRLANKFNDWTNAKTEGGNDKSRFTAQSRFQSEFFNVHSVPKFTIPRGASVYTVGSCFARNVEQALLREGLEVPTTRVDIDPALYVSAPRFKNTVLNKYNPYSMATEILRGLGKAEFPNRGLIEISKGQFYDPNASHLGVMPLADALHVRDELDRIAAQVRTSDIFLLTLGLTESWFDRETSIPFNQINPAHLRSIRKRLEFENASVSSAHNEMAKALSVLRDAVPGAKVVVTVSPVPLLNTFTEWGHRCRKYILEVNAASSCTDARV